MMQAGPIYYSSVRSKVEQLVEEEQALLAARGGRSRPREAAASGSRRRRLSVATVPHIPLRQRRAREGVRRRSRLGLRA